MRNSYKHLYFLLSIVCLLGAMSCKKDGSPVDAVFFADAQFVNSKKVTVGPGGVDVPINIQSSKILNQTVPVSIRFTPSLLDAYNQENGTNYQALPESYYSAASLTTSIEAGTSTAAPLNLRVNSLDGLQEGVQYALALSIDNINGPITALNGSNTLVIVIDRIIVASALQLNSGNRISFDFKTPIKGMRNWSVEFRVKVNAAFRNNMALFSAYPTEIYSRFGDVIIKPNQLQVKVNGPQPSSTSEFAMNTWYHIAYVHNGVTFRIYINGVEDASIPLPTTGRDFDIDEINFGNENTRGQFQELRFWSKALTQTEISNNMCAVVPSTPGLIGYWKFNEGTGNTLNDISGNNNHGTVSGTVQWVQGVNCPD